MTFTRSAEQGKFKMTEILEDKKFDLDRAMKIAFKFLSSLIALTIRLGIIIALSPYIKTGVGSIFEFIGHVISWIF